ncbi:MAG: DinB family protein [Cyclobacteriaceae bacterium]|nr:DinB family protein [Cyclobacteriaceae bacterium]
MNTTPDSATLPSFYSGYVAHVAHLSIADALKWSNEQLLKTLRTLPEEKGTYAYAPGKWTIKEVLCHVMDAERIFAYRALRFARNDKTELPGFDEKSYAPESNAHARTLSQLIEEAKRLRATTIDLFNSFTPDMLKRTGVANNNLVSVLNIGYIIAGHEMHHLSVMKSRYGI